MKWHMSEEVDWLFCMGPTYDHPRQVLVEGLVSIHAIPYAPSSD